STSFTDMHTHTQNMDPAILALLRDKIGGNSMSKTPPHRKLYISRGDVGERNILGESALIEALKKRGYEIIQPGNFSFLDQIKTFSEAHTVIGPHSSGLCNLLFSQPSCKILEIMPSHFGTGVNADLACTLGMDYAFWAEDTGRTFKNFRYLTSYYARDDFSVDIDDILEKESSL
ncbi:MAG: glycosyltransferase family 61 protein, partial [Kordiimonadaceae bacterium]|nr:glycosyltransferase family 61 protein [Kordiimonadaceae bacterium]